MDFLQVDFINSVCPCAGLSMLNTSTAAGTAQKHREPTVLVMCPNTSHFSSPQGRNGVLTARQTSGCWTPLHLCWQGSGPRSDFHNIPSPLIHLFQQVLWGENAPGLFTQIGEGVVNKLKQIGRTFGYSFSLIKTSTELHGIPQRRIRTFYFFWQSPTVPMLQYQKRSTCQISLSKDFL